MCIAKKTKLEVMRSWCSYDSMLEDFYHFHVAPKQICGNGCSNDHHHCGFCKSDCLKLWQVG